jgi:hypothetical protein
MLVIGDVLAVLVVTMIGFATHYGDIRGWRWLSSFLPILASWFAVAPWLGVYHPENSRRADQVWRAGLAALISAPLAATLRGLWLNSAIAPIFVVVLGATNALGFVVWRFLWTLLVQRLAKPEKLTL